MQKICNQMKRGDFTNRASLQNLFRYSKNTAVRRQAIRLFCFTCHHEDVSAIGDSPIEFDDDDLLTFVVAAPDTLSPEVIPYLFYLLSEDKITIEHIDILSAIDRLFPWGYDGKRVELDWLAERFSNFADKLQKGSSYYAGILAHPGNLCKSLIEAAHVSRFRAFFDQVGSYPHDLK